MSTINSNGSMAFGNALGGSVTIIPKNDTATNYTVSIPDVSGTLATQAWANSQDLGVGQTWQDVTASRAFNTTYTNNTGKPIEVLVTATQVPSGSLSVTIGELVVYSTVLHNAGEKDVFPFIVQDGVTYLVSGIMTKNKWVELR